MNKPIKKKGFKKIKELAGCWGPVLAVGCVCLLVRVCVFVSAVCRVG